MPEINSFRDEFSFLSNFSLHPVTVVIHGVAYTFPSNENFFQAMKSNSQLIWVEFQHITPYQSKKRSKELVVREDWDAVKVGFMQLGLDIKFNNPEACALLLATGDAELVEGNYWGDIFWGKSTVTQFFKRHGRIIQAGEGENWLGRLLMQVRANKKEN